jgi:hypothetical protein
MTEYRNVNIRKQHYVEGNAWQLTFFVFQDIPGLANLIGAISSLCILHLKQTPILVMKIRARYSRIVTGG